VHGSAPDLAGQGVANPSGLLLGAIQMLVHVGLPDHATKIANAWLKTLEDGVHTGDIYREGGYSKKQVGTREFTDAVIERLGQAPDTLPAAAYGEGGGSTGGIRIEARPVERKEKKLVGIDVFVDWSDHGRNADVIGGMLEAAAAAADWKLKMITNRGVKVYPDGLPETFHTDHWRCRFVPLETEEATFDEVLDLLDALHFVKLDVIKTEHLYTFDGERGYSLGQGE